MKQTLLRHGYSLLAGLMVMLPVAGCWFSSDSPDNAAKQNPATAEMSTSGHSTAADDETGAIAFEEPELPQPEDVATKGREERKKSPASSPTTVDNKPRVAIIIDDMGNHRKIGDKLLALDLNLSFSFLPHATFASQQAETAYQMGHDVMAHLPMEASDTKWDPGPGALYLSASPEELITTLKKNLAAVPHAIGANNHMGSKFTENRQAMQTVLLELKKQGLFFVDSVTTGQSTAMHEAKKLGIKTNRRQVFLDNVQDPKKVCIQLDKLAALAGKQNQAIGIGHPFQATLDGLRNCGDKLLETVQVVPVHELVE